MPRRARSLSTAIVTTCALGLMGSPAMADVQIQADLSQTEILPSGNDRIYLRLSLKGIASIRHERRMPVNIALVLDRSGSMRGMRLARAKEAAAMALDRLGLDDVISIVAYNHKVDVLVSATRARNHSQLKLPIERLTAGGTPRSCRIRGRSVKATRLTTRDEQVDFPPPWLGALRSIFGGRAGVC